MPTNLTSSPSGIGLKNPDPYYWGTVCGWGWHGALAVWVRCKFGGCLWSGIVSWEGNPTSHSTSKPPPSHVTPTQPHCKPPAKVPTQTNLDYQQSLTLSVNMCPAHISLQTDRHSNSHAATRQCSAVSNMLWHQPHAQGLALLIN